MIVQMCFAGQPPMKNAQGGEIARLGQVSVRVPCPYLMRLGGEAGGAGSNSVQKQERDFGQLWHQTGCQEPQADDGRAASPASAQGT